MDLIVDVNLTSFVLFQKNHALSITPPMGGCGYPRITVKDSSNIIKDEIQYQVDLASFLNIE